MYKLGSFTNHDLGDEGANDYNKLGLELAITPCLIVCVRKLGIKTVELMGGTPNI